MSTTHDTVTKPIEQIHWANEEEAARAFEAAAWRWLGINGEEFLRRWDAGEYRGHEDDVGVINVAVLISLVR